MKFSFATEMKHFLSGNIHNMTPHTPRQESVKEEQMVLIYEKLSHHRQQQKVCISAPVTCREESLNEVPKCKSASCRLLESQGMEKWYWKTFGPISNHILESLPSLYSSFFPMPPMIRKPLYTPSKNH